MALYLAKKIKDAAQRRAGDNHEVDETPAPAQRAQTASGPGWRFKLALTASLCLPVFLELEDFMMITSAQPRIASVFNRLDLQGYIAATYALGYIVSIPILGLVADIFGRHPAMQTALIVISAGSALSTGAQNMPMLLAGRGISGMGVGGITVVYRKILVDSASPDDKNLWLMRMMIFLHTLAWTTGPFIGNALMATSFRWMFGINLPICATASALCFFLLRNKTQKGQAYWSLPTSAQDKEGFMDRLLLVDWPGAINFIGGGVLLLIALHWGSTEKWGTAKVIIPLVLGLLHSATFITWEYILQRNVNKHKPSTYHMLRKNPLIPLDVFRSYDVCAALYSCFIQGMVELVTYYFVSIFSVIVLNVTSDVVGITMIFFVPGMGAGSIASMLAVSRIKQPHYAIIIAGIITTVGIGLVSMAIDQSKQLLANGLLVFTGAGVGLGTGAAGIYIRRLQPEREAALGSLTLVARALGGFVGLAQCGAVMNSKVVSHIASVVQSGTLSSSDIAALGFMGEGWSSGIASLQSIRALPADVQTVVHKAFRIGMQYCFISIIPWCAISVIMVLFLSRIHHSAPKQNSVGGQAENSEIGTQDSQPREIGLRVESSETLLYPLAHGASESSSEVELYPLANDASRSSILAV